MNKINFVQIIIGVVEFVITIISAGLSCNACCCSPTVDSTAVYIPKEKVKLKKKIFQIPLAKVKAEYTLFLGLNIILNNKMFVIFSWKRVKVLFMFKRKTVFLIIKEKNLFRPNFVVSLKIFTKREKLCFCHQLKFSSPFIFSIC